MNAIGLCKEWLVSEVLRFTGTQLVARRAVGTRALLGPVELEMKRAQSWHKSKQAL